jgi:hypothetical protein
MTKSHKGVWQTDTALDQLDTPREAEHLVADLGHKTSWSLIGKNVSQPIDNLLLLNLEP